jgi:hypothetical protein
MRFRGRVVCCAVATIVGSATPALAADVPCGQPGPDGAPTRATLTFDPVRSQNSPLDFKGSTQDKAFHLVYAVGGCSLEEATGLSVRTHADGDVAKAMDRPEPSAKGSFLIVDLNVRATFPTGTATPLLTISGRDVVAVAQPLSMQRKEPTTWPLVITLFAALVGGGIAILTTYLGVNERKRSGETIAWYPLHGVVAVGAGLVATAAVFESSYVKPDTFTLDAVAGLSLFVAVAAAAAGGAKAGAGSTVAVAKGKVERDAKRAREAEARAARV